MCGWCLLYWIVELYVFSASVSMWFFKGGIWDQEPWTKESDQSSISAVPFPGLVTLGNSPPSLGLNVLYFLLFSGEMGGSNELRV